MFTNCQIFKKIVLLLIQVYDFENIGCSNFKRISKYLVETIIFIKLGKSMEWIMNLLERENLYRINIIFLLINTFSVEIVVNYCTSLVNVVLLKEMVIYRLFQIQYVKPRVPYIMCEEYQCDVVGETS